MRHEPLCEWVVVYYDPARLTPDAILERLKQRQCPEAKRIDPVAREKGGIEASLVNPLGGAGDVFQLLVRLPEGKKGKATLKLPEKWNGLDGASVALKGRETRVDIQSPAKDPKAKGRFKDYKATVEVTVAIEEGEETFPFEVQVVDWLK